MIQDDSIEINKSDYFKKLDDKYVNKQRNKKNRYYSFKPRKKRKKDLNKIICELEETGKAIDYISPKDIEDRLLYLYERIIRTNKYVFKNKELSTNRLCTVENYRENMVKKFINLSSIIIGSLITKLNKNKVPELSIELYDSAIMAILKLLKSENYNKNKAKITSWVYEICRWAMIQYIQKKNKENSKTVILF